MGQLEGGFGRVVSRRCEERGFGGHVDKYAFAESSNFEITSGFTREPGRVKRCRDLKICGVWESRAGLVA